MNSKLGSTSIVVFLLVFAFGVPMPASGRTTGGRWAISLKKVEALLISGEYKAARRIAVNTAKQMVDSMGPGQNAAYALGLTLAFRSVAEFGLDNRKDALWYWHVAINLHPDLENIDLSLYGKAGVFLADNKLLRSTECPLCLCQDDAGYSMHDPGPAAREVLPPKVRRKTRPTYPFAAKFFKISGPVAVQVIVQKDGSVSHPWVIESLSAPTMAYEVLETVKKWKFEPAQLNGEPVDVYYQLAVNFR